MPDFNNRLFLTYIQVSCFYPTLLKKWQEKINFKAKWCRPVSELCWFQHDCINRLLVRLCITTEVGHWRTECYVQLITWMDRLHLNIFWVSLGGINFLRKCKSLESWTFHSTLHTSNQRSVTKFNWVKSSGGCESGNKHFCPDFCSQLTQTYQTSFIEWSGLYECYR